MANKIEDVAGVRATINDTLKSISEDFGFGPREEYKALRGLAFQAFGQAIADGTFKQLVKDAKLNAKYLPRGWGMVPQAEPVEEVEEVEEAPTKPTRTRRATKEAEPAKEVEEVEEATKRPTRARRAR